MVNNYKARAGVVGARGYTGTELLKLLRAHPHFEVAFATSETEAGATVDGSGLSYVATAEAPLSEAEVVFACLPGGESGRWAVAARRAGALAVDLSPDLRDGGEGAVYGLPELRRGAVRDARLVANPGCYPTGILLGVAPALRAGLVDTTRPIVVDAASGVTGAGRTPRRALLFGEVAEDYRAYGVGNRHRHVPEIAEGLESLNEGAGVPFVFTPHLLAARRGILETIYLPVHTRLSGSDAVALWTDAYEREPFVQVMDPVAGEGPGLPSLRSVVGRNTVRIGISEVERVPEPLLLVVVALDNLLKGAAGQALQNANLMLGFEEGLGLAC